MYPVGIRLIEEDVLISDVIDGLVEHTERRDVLILVGSAGQEDTLHDALELEAGLDPNPHLAGGRLPAAVSHRRWQHEFYARLLTLTVLC